MALTDQRTLDLIKRVLDDPSAFSDAAPNFLSWLPKQIQDSPTIRFQPSQLPTIDKVHSVDASGGSTGEPQFQSSWVNFGSGNEPARFWIDPWKVVHLSGVVKSGTIGQPIFTLPGGYRPENYQEFAIISNGVFGRVGVDAAGIVTAVSGNNASVWLSGISFRAF
jgi:hypothetical protein